MIGSTSRLNVPVSTSRGPGPSRSDESSQRAVQTADDPFSAYILAGTLVALPSAAFAVPYHVAADAAGHQPRQRGPSVADGPECGLDHRRWRIISSNHLHDTSRLGIYVFYGDGWCGGIAVESPDAEDIMIRYKILCQNLNEMSTRQGTPDELIVLPSS